MHSLPILHATSVVFCGHGLLLCGAPGSGKSDLALRIMDAGGALIADDQTALMVEAGQLFARAPESIKGMMEVRGIGLLKVPTCTTARMDILIDCVGREAIERLPEPAHTVIHGVKLRQLALYPFEASAVAKLRIFLQNQRVSS